MRNAVGTLGFLWIVSVFGLAACVTQDDPAVPSFTDEPQRQREPPPLEAPIRDGDSSLAALTAEVRQLRLAVQDLTRSQSETQALGLSLTAQQSRLQDADQRLAALRDEIVSATAVKEDLEARLADLLVRQAREPSLERRAEIEGQVNDYRREQARVDRQLQQARGRENDLSREVQSEKTRWNDLMARLEQLAQ